MNRSSAAEGAVAGGGASGERGGFEGWPADATAFLAELAADNTAEFWSAQRHRHAQAVRAPLQALAGDLAAEFGELRIFRPYRDRRFRPAAPPYRTDAGGICFSAGGTARAVLLSPAGLVAEVGRFALDGPALRAYRGALGAMGAAGPVAGAGGAVVDGPVTGARPEGAGAGAVPDGTPAGLVPEAGDSPTGAAGALPAPVDSPTGTAAGARLAGVLAHLTAHGFVTDDVRLLSRTPRGVPAAHPHAELLRRRSLLVRRSWPAGPWLGTREPLERVRAAWRAGEPLVAWLDEWVGPA